MWTRTLLSTLFVSLSYVAADGLAAETAREFRYVSENLEGPFKRMASQSVKLSADPPEGVTEEATYRGSSRGYAQIQFGLPGSRRIVLVVDQISRDEFDLYVNSDRSRVVTDNDLVPGAGRIRETTLTVEQAATSDSGAGEKRRVAFRRGFGGKTLSVSTRGYAEGSLSLGGKVYQVRRVDGDGNGMFSDEKDRFWIDRNGDGDWDAFSEQYPLTPTLRLDDRRFAVRADLLGKNFALTEILGTGSIQLNVAALEENASVDVIDVMMMGEDGSAVAIRSMDVPVEVPVGRYAFGTVRIAMTAAKDHSPWKFIFSRNDRPADEFCYDIQKDSTITLDPIGSLDFALEWKRSSATANMITVNPRLYTQDGLLINSSQHGANLDGYASRQSNCALIRLASKTRTIGSTRSGFA